MKTTLEKNKLIKFTICMDLCVILFLTFTESTFKFEDCSNNSTSVFEVMNFSLAPDPINMEQNISIYADVLLLRDLDNSFVMETKHFRMQKMFGFIVDLPIPCIAEKYGSCTFPFCAYFERFQRNICHFFPNTSDCNCPVEPANYKGENIKIKMRRIPAVGRFLVRIGISYYGNILIAVVDEKFEYPTGMYRTELRLKDVENNNTEIACFKIFTELE